MTLSSDFVLRPFPFRWLGGEPRSIAVSKEENFPQGYPSVKDAHLIDVTYDGGGLTRLLEKVANICGGTYHSFQALLEILEGLSSEKALVLVVRDADRLLSDVGPAAIHLITAWESFTHHANGISAMYLVLETGPSAVTQAAFYPGGVVDWLRR